VAAFAFLIEDLSTADALDCGRYQHRDCLWGQSRRLNGLAVLPTDMRSAQSGQVVTRLANALLDATYDFEGEHKRWLTSCTACVGPAQRAESTCCHGYAHDRGLGVCSNGYYGAKMAGAMAMRLGLSHLAH